MRSLNILAIVVFVRLWVLTTLPWWKQANGLAPVQCGRQRAALTKCCATTANSNVDNDAQNIVVGHVERLAVREFHPQDSKPSGTRYTTRKRAVDSCQVTVDGVQGDYNHYRTIALKSTRDRAVSLYTADCIAWLNNSRDDDNNVLYPVKPGDLGENVFINGLAFDHFQPGCRVQFGRGGRVETSCAHGVLLEIAEPATPCGNLCKLPYINDDSKTPSQRIQRCKDFLEHLGQKPGLRGWYAKVITPGVLHVNDSVQVFASQSSCKKVN